MGEIITENETPVQNAFLHLMALEPFKNPFLPFYLVKPKFPFQDKKAHRLVSTRSRQGISATSLGFSSFWRLEQFHEFDPGLGIFGPPESTGEHLFTGKNVTRHQAPTGADEVRRSWESQAVSSRVLENK